MKSTSQLTVSSLEEKLETHDPIILRDGRVVAYRIHSPVEWITNGYPGDEVAISSGDTTYMFVVEVESTGQTAAYSRPFTMQVKRGWPYIVWEITSGQLVALPVSEGALKQNGVLDLWATG